MLTEAEASLADEESVSLDLTESDSSTDIDAVVDEYRQKVKVMKEDVYESKSVDLNDWKLSDSILGYHRWSIWKDGTNTIN